MKNKALLAKLSDRLAELDAKEYDMGTVEKGPLYHAARMSDFKAKGFKWKNGAAHYEGETDIAAAMLLFDIDTQEAQHLFGMYDVDEFGNAEDNGTRFRGKLSDSKVEVRGEEKVMKFPGESPGRTAGRIRAFLNNYDTIRAAKDKVRAA